MRQVTRCEVISILSYVYDHPEWRIIVEERPFTNSLNDEVNTRYVAEVQNDHNTMFYVDAESEEELVRNVCEKIGN